MIFLKTLISLRGLTISEVAERIGSRQANLSQFILGKSGGYLSPAKREGMQKELGLGPDWRLLHGVHIWKWIPKISHSDIEDLLLSVAGGGAVERIVGGGATATRKMKELALGGPEIVYLFTSSAFRILLYSPLSSRLGELNPFNVLQGGGLDWSRLPSWLPPEKGEPRRVDSIMLNRLIEGEDVRIEDVDKMMTKREGKEWTWSAVVSAAMRKKIEPSEAAKKIGLE